jgi:hypothetical protein
MFDVTLLLARSAGCRGSEMCSSLRRTASGSGCEAVLLLLAALILACNTSGPTKPGLVTAGVSIAQGFEKFVNEFGREIFVAAETSLCSSDVLGVAFDSSRFDILRDRVRGEIFSDPALSNWKASFVLWGKECNIMDC